MDLSQLLQQIEAARDFYTLANTPSVQFGPLVRPLLGPTILPERAVDRNEYTEEAIRYKSLIANDGTRYSAAQKRPSGIISGSFNITLGHQDVASEFTSRDYDAVVRYLQQGAGGGPSQEATAILLRWVDNSLVTPLINLMEKQRWDAIIDGQITRSGDNGYSEIVTYPNPGGHRSVAGGAWSNAAYDPYADITAKVDLLYDKGYMANRIITSRKVATMMARNPNIARRAGSVRVLSETDIVGRANLEDVNQMLMADGIPVIEVYEGRYDDLAGTHRYIRDGVMVILSTTGNDEVIAFPNGEPRIMQNTIGYCALGTPAGYSTSGRQLYTEARKDKPPRIEGQAWQSSLPVIIEPESMTVITGIA